MWLDGDMESEGGNAVVILWKRGVSWPTWGEEWCRVHGWGSGPRCLAGGEKCLGQQGRGNNMGGMGGEATQIIVA